ncbi:hypothetical protein Tco_0772552 [Tanacetum coccineum]|uniref:Uncharacterized protein n=1 Tax=Tanacetum coccineum TaxID=301880 RepID=A0ABQ4ZJK6_9ASTR
MALHSLFALHVFDLDRPLPYTSHPPMVLLGIASMDKWECQSVKGRLLEALGAVCLLRGSESESDSHI